MLRQVNIGGALAILVSSVYYLYYVDLSEDTFLAGDQRSMREQEPSISTHGSYPTLRFGDGDGRKEGSRHASSPSNSGKTVEKPSVIHTRR